MILANFLFAHSLYLCGMKKVEAYCLAVYDMWVIFYLTSDDLKMKKKYEKDN